MWCICTSGEEGGEKQVCRDGGAVRCHVKAHDACKVDTHRVDILDSVYFSEKTISKLKPILQRSIDRMRGVRGARSGRLRRKRAPSLVASLDPGACHWWKCPPTFGTGPCIASGVGPCIVHELLLLPHEKGRYRPFSSAHEDLG